MEGTVWHQAYEQPGGAFNQSVPYANTPQQSLAKASSARGQALDAALAKSRRREKVSYFTANSNYERTYRRTTPSSSITWAC